MPEPDLLDDVRRLAPTVDTAVAHDAFRLRRTADRVRRRRISTALSAVVVLALGGALAVALPSEPTDEISTEGLDGPSGVPTAEEVAVAVREIAEDVRVGEVVEVTGFLQTDQFGTRLCYTYGESSPPACMASVQVEGVSLIDGIPGVDVVQDGERGSGRMLQSEWVHVEGALAGQGRIGDIEGVVPADRADSRRPDLLLASPTGSASPESSVVDVEGVQRALVAAEVPGEPEAVGSVYIDSGSPRTIRVVVAFCDQDMAVALAEVFSAKVELECLAVSEPAGG